MPKASAPFTLASLSWFSDKLVMFVSIVIVIIVNIIIFVVNILMITCRGLMVIMIMIIIMIIIMITRPKPAYGRQGPDWIVGPGYSFVVFSTNKTMETNQKP